MLCFFVPALQGFGRVFAGFGSCQLLDLCSHHRHRGELTWTGSWPGNSEAAQHDVCRSRNDADFSPAHENKPEKDFNESK